MKMMAIVVVGRNEVLQLTVVAGVVDVDSRMMRSDYGGVGGCDGDGGEDGGCGVDCGQMRQQMMREQVENMRCDHVVDSCDCCYGGDRVRRKLGGGGGNYCCDDDADGDDDMGRWEILSRGKIVAAVAVAVYLVGSDHCVHSNVVGNGGGWSDIVVLWCQRESWDHCCCCCCCCSDGGWRTGAS